jgi:hypothetical protein
VDIDVLLSSGDRDGWSDLIEAKIDMTLGGALVLSSRTRIEATYAGGMWMKFERTDEALDDD